MTRPAAYRLADETSPYLLQHAGNPVEWYPWGPEALTRAAEEDKPILLSIGYSACHWCHVMAHESFEDEPTAALMNALYVNIKVDREERPDLDKIYQLAHAALTRRSGGWPLTMFLTPGDLVPFFGGTYFPREPRQGMAGFGDLLQRIADFYAGHRDDVRQQSAAMEQFFASLEAGPESPHGALSDALPGQARAELEEAFDARHGGFGRAPKFPHPTSIERALRHWHRARQGGEADDKALHIAAYTLEKMARGGLYDQLGGGFYRYSVDDYWAIPHFEKMLYDNGALLALYADAWSITHEALFERVCVGTAEWAMREMQSADGGYYSSLDADSEGHEGKFYAWHRDEVREVVGNDSYPLAAAHFGLDQPANFEGRWHLTAALTAGGIGNRFGQPLAAVEAVLEEARARLLEARERRVRPGRDDKVLTSWNALMIKGMVRAGRVLGRADLIASAERALDFVRTTLWRDQRLLATCRDGRARFGAYLDDHAFLIDALLELLQARWRTPDLAFACSLADALLEHFHDPDRGGFYFTADDHERLIHRPRPLADEATPSGNGVAALVLTRLGHLLGETRYLAAARDTLDLAAGFLHQSSLAHASVLSAYEEISRPAPIVILRGRGAEPAEWALQLSRDYAPGRMVLAIDAETGDLPPALADKAPLDRTVAYVCRGPVCAAPITDLEELLHAAGAPPAADVQ